MTRIDEMESTPVINLIQKDRDLCDLYSAWMRQAGRTHFERGQTPVGHAQQVLGRQDFCWTGSCRNWIWVRPFQANLGDRTVLWHWRLFASKRGYVLEIETKGRPHGEPIRKAGPQGLADFIKTWEAARGL